MKRNLAFRLLICLALLAIPFVLPSPASACSCMMPGTPAEAFRDYAAVFSGTVTGISGTYSPVVALLDQILIRLNLSPTYYYTNGFWGNAVTFSVNQSWKGVTATEVVVYTGSGGGDCGYSFDPGYDYVVYAYPVDGTSGSGLGTGICTRTTEMSYASDDLSYLSTLPTLALTPVSNYTGWYVAGCILMSFMILGAGIGLWFRRRKRQLTA